MSKKIIIIIALLSFGLPLPLLADGISAAEHVYKNVNKSVFMIFDIKDHNYKAPVEFGSGIAITRDIIATNCHVALKGDDHLVKIERTLEPSQEIYHDELHDLCLLKINQKILSPVTLRSGKSVRIGEEVFTIGSPKGYEKTMSRGIISNKIAYNNSAILQTDAAVSPGSSGGGLFDTHGKLIGIIFLKNRAEGVEGIGFALPTELITAAIDQLHHYY
jgi:serine protease Do